MTDQRNPRILLIGDNGKNIADLQETLGDLKVEIAETASSEEAIQRILVTDFSLIVLGAPPGQSIETARMLKKVAAAAHLPIILWTAGVTDDAMIEQAYDAGVTDIISPPVHKAMLQNKITALIAHGPSGRHINAKAPIVKKENPKVLVVDDTPANLLVMKKLLARLEVDVTCVSSGNEALTQTLYNDFAVVFLDVQMPGMDGYEVAELMKSNESTADIPIIFLTAIDRNDAKEVKGYDKGAVDFIFKPINEFILLSKAQIFLDLYNLRANLEALVEERTFALQKSNEKLRQEMWNKEMAQKDLIRMKEYLRSVFNSMSTLLIGADMTGTISNINLVAQQHSGISPDDAIGKNIADIFPEFNDTITELTGELRTRKEPIKRNNVPISRDGSDRIYFFSINPLVDAHMEQVVISIADVTETRQMEEELQQRRHIDSLGQLAGGIAHDFNNLLTAIMGASELLQMIAEDKPEFESPIQTISVSVERAAELTGKLLSFARKSGVEKVPVDIHQILKDTTTILKRSIDKRIEVAVKPEAAHSIIEGGVSELSNALLNLGVNARDAMPDGGTLTYKTANYQAAGTDQEQLMGLAPGEYVRVEISDTGTGIPEEIQKKVFEPFFTTKDPGKGTGLGLASVYGTVKEHSGVVQLDSAMGKGTVFSLYFPISAQAASMEGQAVKSLEDEKFHGTVLFIDDEDIVRAIGAELLKSLGLNVLLAGSGHEAFDLIKQHRNEISLILLDMVMPELNGKDCYMEIRRIMPEANVVLCSGFTPDADIKELEGKGVKGFIPKPFYMSGLREAMAAYLPA